MKNETTIACEHRGSGSRKITKIKVLRDGFTVLVPYHRAETGLLTRQPCDLSGLTTRWSRISEYQRYRASTKAKLTFHLSGFVHFSGEGIRSGYDRETGIVKGLGLKGDCPVDISTGGPALSITLWGLGEFKELGNKSANVMMFRGDDLYVRGDPGARNGYDLECFLLRKDRFTSGIRSGPRGTEWRGYLPILSVIAFEHTLKVIDLPGLPFFLGVMMTHIETSFASSSGFVLTGPAYRGPNDPVSISISAFYPTPFSLDGAVSLDYPGDST